MKNLLFTLAFFLLALGVSAQDGLIADLLDVEAVEAAEGANIQEMQDAYQKEFDDSSTKLDESIEKLNAEYKKLVTKQIEDFSKVLAKGEKQPTKNAKLRTSTKINSATISLRSKKKSFLAKWRSKNFIATQKLPKAQRKVRQEELKEKMEEYNTAFDEEYDANMAAIKSFKSKEHLVETEPDSSGSEN